MDPRDSVGRMDPGTRLAGFIKRTTIYCYTENMKALDLDISENKIFCVFPTVSLSELSVAMETRVLIRPGPKLNLMYPFPPMMLQINFDCNWLTSCQLCVPVVK